jgi:CubicO group peptidase (beta-lactamase class C family)
MTEFADADVKGDIKGTCADRFAAVREAFAENFARGEEVGACVCIYVDGEKVVDLWAGSTDTANTTPWQEDTIINVWSTTKTMMFLTCLMLADHGELDLYAPVARYWPEFAANGKDGIEVRMLLSHTAGLSGWDEPMTEADLWDHDTCATLLAAQAPWWEPGSASGYHAITQGYLIGEVVRRVTGTSLGTFFHKEIAAPLGADFHIGTGPEHDHRVALVIPAEQGLPPDLDPSSVAARTFLNPPMDARMAHTLEWRRCESAAANGHGNARSVARVQSVLSHGGEVDGVRFLSEAGCRVALGEQISNVDLVLGMPVRMGMGYGLPLPDLPIGGPGACFWGGWGGSLCVNDLDQRMTFAYVMNRMGEGTVGDQRGGALLMAAYGALGAG